MNKKHLIYVSTTKYILSLTKKGGKHMDKEKKESVRQTTENFLKKTEIEKAFILGYMVKRMQLKELDADSVNTPELVMK